MRRSNTSRQHLHLQRRLDGLATSRNRAKKTTTRWFGWRKSKGIASDILNVCLPTRNTGGRIIVCRSARTPCTVHKLKRFVGSLTRVHKDEIGPDKFFYQIGHMCRCHTDKGGSFYFPKRILPASYHSLGRIDGVPNLMDDTFTSVQHNASQRVPRTNMPNSSESMGLSSALDPSPSSSLDIEESLQMHRGPTGRPSSLLPRLGQQEWTSIRLGYGLGYVGSSRLGVAAGGEDIYIQRCAVHDLHQTTPS
jgi:hypothetical protein